MPPTETTPLSVISPTNEVAVRFVATTSVPKTMSLTANKVVSVPAPNSCASILTATTSTVPTPAETLCKVRSPKPNNETSPAVEFTNTSAVSARSSLPSLSVTVPAGTLPPISSLAVIEISPPADKSATKSSCRSLIEPPDEEISIVVPAVIDPTSTSPAAITSTEPEVLSKLSSVTSPNPCKATSPVVDTAVTVEPAASSKFPPTSTTKPAGGLPPISSAA